MGIADIIVILLFALSSIGLIGSAYLVYLNNKQTGTKLLKMTTAFVVLEIIIISLIVIYE